MVSGGGSAAAATSAGVDGGVANKHLFAQENTESVRQNNLSRERGRENN